MTTITERVTFIVRQEAGNLKGIPVDSVAAHTYFTQMNFNAVDMSNLVANIQARLNIGIPADVAVYTVAIATFIASVVIEFTRNIYAADPDADDNARNAAAAG